MNTLWACDFFVKDVWTGFGKVTYYVLFFINVGTRRVRIAGATCRPNGPWVEQQARNLVMDLADRGWKGSCLLKDGDMKFTKKKFDEIFKSEGIKVKRLPFASPDLNAYAERFVQTIKAERLNQFVVFGERHLDMCSANSKTIATRFALTKESKTAPSTRSRVLLKRIAPELVE